MRPPEPPGTFLDAAEALWVTMEAIHQDLHGDARGLSPMPFVRQYDEMRMRLSGALARRHTFGPGPSSASAELSVDTGKKLVGGLLWLVRAIEAMDGLVYETVYVTPTEPTQRTSAPGRHRPDNWVQGQRWDRPEEWRGRRGARSEVERARQRTEPDELVPRQLLVPLSDWDLELPGRMLPPLRGVLGLAVQLREQERPPTDEETAELAERLRDGGMRVQVHNTRRAS